MFRYAVPGAAVDSGVDDICYESELKYVDMLWQGLPENRDDLDTSSFLRRCLESHGIKPKGTEVEVNKQMDEAGITGQDCVDRLRD